MKVLRSVVGLSLALVVVANAAEQKKAGPTPEERGFAVFGTYCLACHGPYADGKGKAAKNLNPPPANLKLSTASDEYKENIIRQGGEAMGRSPFMPPWGDELSSQQIQDVIAYLRRINVNKPALK